MCGDLTSVREQRLLWRWYQIVLLTHIVRMEVQLFMRLMYAGVSVQRTGKEILTAANQQCRTRTSQRPVTSVSNAKTRLGGLFQRFAM